MMFYSPLSGREISLVLVFLSWLVFCIGQTGLAALGVIWSAVIWVNNDDDDYDDDDLTGA